MKKKLLLLLTLVGHSLYSSSSSGLFTFLNRRSLNNFLSIPFFKQLSTFLSNHQNSIHSTYPVGLMKYFFATQITKYSSTMGIIADACILCTQKTFAQWEADHFIKAWTNSLLYKSEHNPYKMIVTDLIKFCAKKYAYKLATHVLEKKCNINDPKKLFQLSIISVFIAEKIYEYYMPKKLTAEETLEKQKKELDDLEKEVIGLKTTIEQNNDSIKEQLECIEECVEEIKNEKQTTFRQAARWFCCSLQLEKSDTENKHLNDLTKTLNEKIAKQEKEIFSLNNAIKKVEELFKDDLIKEKEKLTEKDLLLAKKENDYKRINQRVEELNKQIASITSINETYRALGNSQKKTILDLENNINELNEKIEHEKLLSQKNIKKLQDHFKSVIKKMQDDYEKLEHKLHDKSNEIPPSNFKKSVKKKQ